MPIPSPEQVPGGIEIVLEVSAFDSASLPTSHQGLILKEQSPPDCCLQVRQDIFHPSAAAAFESFVTGMVFLMVFMSLDRATWHSDKSSTIRLNLWGHPPTKANQVTERTTKGHLPKEYSLFALLLEVT